MNFVVFNLSDFHEPSSDGTRVRVRFVTAKNLEAAKDLMSTSGAWAVVPKKTFDKGIVNAREERTECQR